MKRSGGDREEGCEGERDGLLRGGRSRTRNLASGSVYGSLIAFMAPLLASSLIQQLYNTVDIMFIGQCLDANASAAVGSGGLLITLLLGLFTGLSVGAGVIAAKAFGAGRFEELRSIVHSTMGVSLAAGLLFMAASVALVPAFLVLLNVPDEIRSLAQLYLRIYFLSMLSAVVFNLSAGLLRATGDSRSPMLYQLFGGVANVGADVLLIAVLGAGVAGAAIASVCSQSIAAVLCVRRLMKADRSYALRFRGLRVDWDKVRLIARIGVPSAVQAMLITASNLFVQAAINTLDITSIAAFTVYFKVENFIYMPCGALGQAAMTYVAQNVGAAQGKRACSGVRASLLTGVAIVLLLEALILGFAPAVFGCFSADAAVVAMGASIAGVSFPFYFLYVFIEVFSGAIRGTGRALAPMVAVLGTLGAARVAIVSLIMTIDASAQAVAAAYPITWALAAACLAAYYYASRCVSKAAQTGEAVKAAQAEV